MSRLSLVQVMCAGAVAAAFLLVPAAHAADPAVRCEAGKLKEAGKYGNCRLKADSKGVKKGEAADYTKCVDKFTDKWGKVETKAGPTVCPSEADVGSIDLRITTDAAEIATLLAGGSLPASCGNGTVDAGEDCDFGDLDGETCATQGVFGDGLACGVGCVFDTSGCSATRYEDTGLGTVIDHQTGLEWQKTDDAGGLTDKDNTYRWSDSFDNPDGSAFTEFLYRLNDCESFNGAIVESGGYAGHCDWRMPQIDELLTIVDCAFGVPCIDESVFGPIASSFYWSASTVDGFSGVAWYVFFDFGNAGSNFSKGYNFRVRAVRGGS